MFDELGVGQGFLRRINDNRDPQVCRQCLEKRCEEMARTIEAG
jgi:hypothetical protein